MSKKTFHLFYMIENYQIIKIIRVSIMHQIPIKIQ